MEWIAALQWAPRASKLFLRRTSSLSHHRVGRSCEAAANSRVDPHAAGWRAGAARAAVARAGRLAGRAGLSRPGARRGGLRRVHLQHAGSDAAIWQGAADPRAAMMRPPSTRPPHSRGCTTSSSRSTSSSPGASRAWRPTPAGSRSPGTPMAPGRRPTCSASACRCRAACGCRIRGCAPGSRCRRSRRSACRRTGAYRRRHRADAVCDRERGIRGSGVPDWRARTVGYRNAAGPAVLAVLDGANHAAFAGEEERRRALEQPGLPGTDGASCPCCS